MIKTNGRYKQANYLESTHRPNTYHQNRTETDPTRKTTRTANYLTQILENEQQERERERRQLQETINDLRRRLDDEAQERRKLTALLTHQPQQQPEPESRQPEASLLWRKLFGKR